MEKFLKTIMKRKLQNISKKDEIFMHVDLLLGNGKSKVWTCDLTKKYIEINADYRS